MYLQHLKDSFTQTYPQKMHTTVKRHMFHENNPCNLNFAGCQNYVSIPIKNELKILLVLTAICSLSLLMIIHNIFLNNCLRQRTNK